MVPVGLHRRKRKKTAPAMAAHIAGLSVAANQKACRHIAMAVHVGREGRSRARRTTSRTSKCGFLCVSPEGSMTKVSKRAFFS